MAYAAAAAAAIAQAIKASGAIVNMSPDDFMSIVDRCDKPLVVMAHGGLLDRSMRYLVSYKGLVFHTKSKVAVSYTHLTLPTKRIV
mgnify:CR=1 FL=1